MVIKCNLRPETDLRPAETLNIFQPQGHWGGLALQGPYRTSSGGGYPRVKSTIGGVCHWLSLPLVILLSRVIQKQDVFWLTNSINEFAARFKQFAGKLILFAAETQLINLPLDSNSLLEN